MATADGSGDQRMTSPQRSATNEIASKISNEVDETATPAASSPASLLSQRTLEAQGEVQDSDVESSSADKAITGDTFLTQPPMADCDDEDSSSDGSKNEFITAFSSNNTTPPQTQESPQCNDEMGTESASSDAQLEDNYHISRSKLQFPRPSFQALPSDSSESDDDDSTSSGGNGYEDANDDSPEEKNLPILEVRCRNMKRNNQRLVALGLALPSPGTKEHSNDNQNGLSPLRPPTPKPLHAPLRGMLFATPYNSSQYNSDSFGGSAVETDEAVILEGLQDAYPHRDSQIQQLWSLMSPALPSTTSTCPSFTTNHIPAPIFVTGTAGTGKTSVVRDVVTCLKRSRLSSQTVVSQARVGSAYVNCATLGLDTTIDELLHNAYGQLAAGLKAGRQYYSPRRRRKRKSQKKKPYLLPTSAATGTVSDSQSHAKKRRTEPTDTETESHISQTCTQALPNASNVQSKGDTSTGAPTKGDPAREGQSHALKNTDNDKVDPKQFEPRRSRRVQLTETEGQIKDKVKTKKELSADLKATTSPSGEMASSTAAKSRSAQMAATCFGQDLKESLFKHPQDAAFLILDNAERLLSLSSSPAKTNFLAQLLLLPRDKQVNLTIIVITKSIMLEHSRFNNLVAIEKSLTTLASAIQPMQLHFPAYKGKDRFREILSRRMLLQRIVGPDILRSFSSGNSDFTKRVVNSFLNMLVQSLYGGCRDLKEIVRLGRSLWPLYVLPLHSTRIELTMKSVDKMCPSPKGTLTTTTTDGKHILAYLDQQILPQIRQKLDRCIYTLLDDGLSHDVSKHVSSSGDSKNSYSHKEGLQSVPYLTKCLMLAAFICQTNRADKDKQLFTIQKNGKKNNGNKRKSPGEDVAFSGASKNAISKQYRPRMFPMERMLSVFVSIVGLNQGQANSNEAPPVGDAGVDPSATGSSDFFESLSHLRDMGVLHDRANGKASSAEDANPAAPRFWCSLTKDEADTVSRSVSFNLENYLI